MSSTKLLVTALEQDLKEVLDIYVLLLEVFENLAMAYYYFVLLTIQLTAIFLFYYCMFAIVVAIVVAIVQSIVQELHLLFNTPSPPPTRERRARRRRVRKTGR